MKMNRKKPIWLPQTSIVMAVLAALLTVLVLWAQLEQYQSAVLESYAAGQDVCVELLLGQIDLLESCADEDIIALLGKQESTSTHYWVYTHGLLRFTGDAAGQYQDMTAAAYFSSESAAAFLTGVDAGGVCHGEILLDGRAFLASGMSFPLQGETAQIFLLTDKTALLADSRLSSLRLQLYVLAGAGLAFLLLLSALLALRLWQSQRQAACSRTELEDAYRRLACADRNGRLLHNTLWREDMLLLFEEKLRERGVAPLVRSTAHCADRTARTRLMQRAQALLPPSVLRFEAGETDVRFLFLRQTQDQAAAALAPLACEGVALSPPQTVTPEDGTS